MPIRRAASDAPFTPTNLAKSYALDYLLGWEPEHPHVPTPDAVGRHPDDIIGGWRDEHSEAARDITGTHPVRRMFNRGDIAVRAVEDALTVAGFLPHEINLINQSTQLAHTIEHTLTAMWEYRRFGFPVDAAVEWHRRRIEPHVARVYADAGYEPATAQGIQQWSYEAQVAGGTLCTSIPHYRERLILTVIGHRISRKRAIEYVNARIGFDEIPAWERRHHAGENVRDALRTLAALNG